MMVVIVVSRRVGQVTLAVSERTSCRNLNGLKAIVGTIRVRRQTYLRVVETEQPFAAQPSSRRMSRQAGSIVRGLRPRRRSVCNGPAAGWAVCTAGLGKRQAVPRGPRPTHPHSFD